MIQFFKFCLISTLSLQGASYVIPSQASSICELSKRSIRYGDLASWNQANSCQTIDLDPQLCRLGISYAENEEVKKSLQRATAGNAVVYLLPEVVIKELGEDESKSRRKKDELALQIIEEKGYDHLAVPSSCVQSSYSINERLPIMNFSDSGLLYYQHPDDFTSAVEQFVHLTLEVPLTDIISTLGNPRFDNVVPYLTEESGKWIGKLGLVDLEHFAPGKETSWEMARDLIQFFPHHYENIVNIIQQSHPEWIEQRQKEFQVARNSAIKHLLLYTFNAGLENSDVVTRYLEKGAIPAEVVNDTLKAAAVNGLTKLIKKLLEQNVSSSTSRDKSLVFAAEYGHEDIVKILLETENLSLEYKGRAVVQSADQHPDIAKMVLKTGSIFPQHLGEALVQSCGGKDITLFEMLLKVEAMPQMYREQALFKVSSVPSQYSPNVVDFVELLLKNGAISFKIRGEALIRAILMGNKEIAEQIFKQKDMPLDFRRNAKDLQRLQFGNENDIIDLLECVPLRCREEVFYRAIFSYAGKNLSEKILQKWDLSPEFLGEILIEAVEGLAPSVVDRILKIENLPLAAIRQSLDIAVKSGYESIEETLRKAIL